MTVDRLENLDFYKDDMKKLILVVLMAIGLTGCFGDTGEKPMTPPSGFNTICLDGVVYYVNKEWAGYNGYGYMAPKFNTDSEVVTCK